MKSRSYRSIRALVDLPKMHPWWTVGAMLLAMFGLALWAMIGNSLTMDEQAHIPSGYSYVRYGDYRLNPEHPPLIKDLAGLPLLLLMPDFPVNLPLWTTGANEQWEAGKYMLFHLNTNADALIFWARLPILLLTVGFGLWLFGFVKGRYGKAAGLLAVGLFAFSPNFLAHSTLVTTDVGASIAFFWLLAAFAQYMRHPAQATFGWLVVALTIAQLVKFSAIVVMAFLLVAAVVVAWGGRRPLALAQRVRTYVGGYVAAMAASVVAVWIAYVPHVWNMPGEVQDHLIRASIWVDSFQWLAQAMTQINDIVIFKPLMQYMLGLLMVFGRVKGGNVTYFNGHTANESFWLYFPEVFALKTQVALLIVLAVLVAVLVRRAFFGQSQVRFAAVGDVVRRHPFEWLLAGFVAFYMAISISGNLNLGIRHILPIYLPIFVLAAWGAVRVGREWWRHVAWRRPLAAAAVVLGLWYVASPVSQAPSFIAYFNEIVGGPANADKYFSDSSVDWGQDLKRLKAYMDENPQINHLALDYFGGSVPEYYFCGRTYTTGGELVATPDGYDCSKSKIELWHVDNGRYPGQYIAVSETLLVNDEYFATREQRPGYEYLREREPVARIGSSIYVYKLY